MATFRSPEKQAKQIGKEFNKTKELKSVKTIKNYQERLVQVARWASQWHIGLKELTPEHAIQYLEDKKEDYSQKTLDMDRQAMQAMFRHVTNRLDEKSTLKVIKSEKDFTLSSRKYTPEQVAIVASAQTKHAFSTELAYKAGLRAHELLTITRKEERKMDDRPALASKFTEREGVIYTVKGKGGLVREVLIPHHLAAQLEEKRLDSPRTVTDRGVNATQHYDITGGQRWSNSFSAAANRSLGWSRGGHGLRHSYTQERIGELSSKIQYEAAKQTASQELGHFRTEITETYLR